MKFYNLLIKYRLQLGIALMIIGGVTNYFSGFWPAFPLYFVGLILVLGHFFFGPLRLIQEYLESGDMDGAEKVLNTIKFPGLLYKPIRSAYYTLKGNVAMMEAEGASMLQMGMLSMQKNDMKQAESYIRQAIRKGLPDKENESAAYLQMCSIMMNKREFRAAKDFFSRAKKLKPTTKQIVDQIKQLEKYITRIPG